jgi:hypothetical protein
MLFCLVLYAISSASCDLLVPLGPTIATVRSQAKDSDKAEVEQGEFDEELSKREVRLPLSTDC